jgi:argininosuccinate lyase
MAQPAKPEGGKSWEARIGEATDALGVSFVESISYDRRMYRQDIAGSVAHAAMLAKVGLITESERAAIEQGLRSIESDIDAGSFVFDESLEDIHMVIEDALTRRIGDPGRKLHTGRSRNDQVALDLLLWLRQASAEARQKVDDLCRAFIRLAERSGDIVMPSYTHVQRAQPISAAAEALAWCSMFQRDARRLDAVAEAISRVSPLGSGAIAGSSLPLDPAHTASLLGFASGPVNSIDHTASRDEACGLLYALSMTAMHLSRWAEQWIMYMSTEFSFLRIADRYTTSSSMMPQKKNPDMIELIRGRCGNIYGDLFALLTILKGLPIGYNRDLQEDKRIVFRAFDMAMSCLTMAAAVVASASFVKENIQPTLERGFLDATSLAEYLVTRSVPFRTAHGVVGTLVAACEKSGRTSISQLTLDEINAVLSAVSPVRIDADVYSCLGAAGVVARYRSAGAAGGAPLTAQLAEWKRRLNV